MSQERLKEEGQKAVRMKLQKYRQSKTWRILNIEFSKDWEEIIRRGKEIRKETPDPLSFT